MTTILRSKPRTIPVAIAAGALLVAGCSSLEISGVDDGPAFIDLFLQVPEGQSASVAPDGSFNVQIGDGEVDLTIVSAQLIWDDIEFARTADDCVISETADDGDECNEVAVQPSVLDLQIETAPQEVGVFRAPVEPGSYQRFQFALHVAESGESGFLTQGFQEGTSVMVVGNIEDADGTSDVSSLFGPTGLVELSFPNPISLEAGESAQIFLTVDVASWFRDENGDVIDPREADDGGALAATVRENIIQSFALQGGG